jgi:pyrroloquinoline-quinone synthase
MVASCLEQIDQLIEEHSILQHPFYQAWCAGELHRSELAVYAWAYYPHVQAFPHYILNALEKTQDPFLRELLQENYDEEMGEGDPAAAHPELWLQLAVGLGVSREEVLTAQPVPEVQEAIQTFSNLCALSPSEALAALYTYEKQQPLASACKIKSLNDYYQIHDEQTLRYFVVHESADVKHSEEVREALGYCLEQGASVHTMLNSAQAALDAQWMLLDGICHQAGLFC